MRHIVPIVASFAFMTSVATAKDGQRGFMPKNSLHTEDKFNAGGLTEAQFNAVIDKAERLFRPIFSGFGATLTVDRAWSDATVNAYAEQSGNTWSVHMFGGLARRQEVTEDGFAMVLCHEMGHHVAGYPFVEDWAANEGQSDIYATGACAQKLFNNNLELAAKALADVPDDMKAKCDGRYPANNDRSNCYRALAAGKSLADLLAALGGGTVSFDTPDTSTVSRTNNDHPAAQCRLDTYVAGALCGSDTWDHTLIPGKSLPNRNSVDAQNQAFEHSCETGEGARPTCWFHAVNGNEPEPTECPFGDQAICDLLCQLDPSQPFCN